MTRTPHVGRRASRSQDGLARFSLLDTVRQYCLDRLDDEKRSTACRITSSNAHTSCAIPRITVGERSTQHEPYLRLAAMDLPALRWLIVDLTRVSDESAASAVREGTAEAAARALRNAQRAAAAQAALASAEVAD